MKTTKEEKYRKYLRILKNLSNGGTPVIVEGPKDSKKLRSIGLRGPIIPIQGKKVHQVVEGLTKKEVIILTDFDFEGRKHSSQLKKECERNKIRANTELRKKIFSNCFANKVEELPTKPLNNNTITIINNLSGN